MTECSDQALDRQERELFEKVCTAGIERCRRSWEAISANEKIYGHSAARNQGNPAGVEYIRNYRRRVEGEIRATCEDALRLIDKFILPQLDSQRGNPSFSKMKADLAKFQDGFEPSTTPAAGGGLDAARKVRTEVAPAETAAAPNAPLAPNESAGSDGRPGALHHLGGILTPDFRCAILNGFQVRSRLYRSRCLEFRSHVQVLAAMYRIRSYRRSRSSTLRAFDF